MRHRGRQRAHDDRAAAGRAHAQRAVPVLVEGHHIAGFDHAAVGLEHDLRALRHLRFVADTVRTNVPRP